MVLLLKKNISNVLDQLNDGDGLPALFYCSTKKNCDFIASLIRYKYDFLDEDEQKNMETVIGNVMEKYKNSEVIQMELMTYKEMYLRGIAVHHSGLLKVTRSFVETCLEYKHIVMRGTNGERLV